MARLREVLEHERGRFLRLLEGLEPEQWDAATRCEGWDVADLVAHMVVRQREVITTGPGLVLGGPFAAYTERRRRRARSRGRRWLLERLRGANPRLPIGYGSNISEYFIHHEDVRRGELQRPREAPVDDDLRRVLWGIVKFQAKVQAVKVDVDGVLELRTPDDRSVRVSLRRKVPVTATGDPDVTVTGEPGELLLWITGRREVADVEVEGTPAVITALEGAELGL